MTHTTKTAPSATPTARELQEIADQAADRAHAFTEAPGNYTDEAEKREAIEKNRAEYHRQEVARRTRENAHRDGQTGTQRAEASAAALELFRDPQVLAERADFLFAGHYGYGPQFFARQTATAATLTATRKSEILACEIAANECNAGARACLMAFQKLTDNERLALYAAISGEIEADQRAQREDAENERAAQVAKKTADFSGEISAAIQTAKVLPEKITMNTTTNTNTAPAPAEARLVHLIKASYKSATATRGSRVILESQRFENHAVIFQFDSATGGVLQQGEKWLQENGFNPIFKAEAPGGVYFFGCTKFERLAK